MEKLENLKQQVLTLDEDELFDIYEFVDDLILAKTLKKDEINNASEPEPEEVEAPGLIILREGFSKKAGKKGSRNESLFENKEYIQD